jgi:hypothetical protein
MRDWRLRRLGPNQLPGQLSLRARHHWLRLFYAP